MKERILISKPKLEERHGIYVYKYEEIDQKCYCNTKEWKLYEVKYRLFINGAKEEDLNLLIEYAQDLEHGFDLFSRDVVKFL